MKMQAPRFFICVHFNLTLIIRIGAWAETMKSKNNMAKIKIESRNLSKDEGNTIKSIVGVIVDVIVTVTGGKPTFGKKK